MPCQIVLLQVQSKSGPSKAAMQLLHGWRHIFIIYFSAFPGWQRRASRFCDSWSVSASAK